MSWLARSLANSLRLDDDGAETDAAPTPHHHDSTPARRIEEARKAPSSSETGRDFVVDEEEREEGEEAHGRGVREDLTELTQTLTRQLWGVATFLAPPPPPPPPPPLHPRSVPNSKRSYPGDRSMNDSGETSGIGQEFAEFAEIGGSLRTGVAEISKMASNYFPFGSEENQLRNRDGGGGGGGGGGGNVVENYEELESQKEDEEEWEAEPVGITDEVLAFAKNIAMHPETWLDFPLDQEEDLDDFVMSDAQWEHAMAIEQLAPRLAALRIELCPCHMTESYFWKVYFVLLHSRLNKHDAEILSTPQVMEARAMWMKELHKQTKPESDWSGSGNLRDDHTLQHEDFAYGRTFYSERTANKATDYETEKHPIVSRDVHFVDKSVIEEKPVMKTEDKDEDQFVHFVGSSSKILNQNYEDDEVDWPEDDSDLGGYKTTIPLGDEDDISFSDLEDDANSTIPIKSKILAKGSETTRR